MRRVIDFLKHNKYAVAWSVLILSVILSVFVRVPFAFYDEHVHYIRAVGVGNGQMLSYSKDGDMTKLGHDINDMDQAYIQAYMQDSTSKEAVNMDLFWLLDDIGSESSSSANGVYSVNTSAAPYTPIPYLSYGIASAGGQLVGVSIETKFILMRIVGAIASLLIVFAAFCLAPRRYKWTVLAVALVPMSIASFAGISTDGFTIASVLLFMAALLRNVEKIQTQKLTGKDIVVLGGASGALVTAKMPAFLLIALILAVIILFWKKIKQRHRVYLFSIIGITAVLTLAWAWYAKDINTGAFWGREVDTVQQLEYIASAPVTYAKNLVYSVISYNYNNVTYLLYANSEFYTNLPFIVDVVILIGLMLSPFVSTKQRSPTKEQRKLYWAQVGLFVMAVCAIFTLLYLQFTPIGTPNRIEGVQSRYFLPFLLLLVTVPHTFRLSRGWRIFTYMAPFIGIAVYLGFIVAQFL